MILISDLTSVASSFSTALSISALLVALVLGVLNIRNKYASGQDAQTIRSLKNSNEAYKTQAETDQLRFVAKQKEVEGIYQQNKLLVQKAEILEQHVTQAPQINKLTIQLATQHKEMMKAMAEMSKNNAKLTIEIGNIAKAMTRETTHADKR